MSKVALMVVDVQTALVNGHPYNEQKVIRNIQSLLSAARENRQEVIYVRHDDGKGTELEYGTDGWQIYAAVAPNKNEKIFEKHYNSAFHKTELKSYLESKGIDTLLLTGMQTEYCIDATLKSAFDGGYTVIVPEETNTTFDNEYLPGDKLYRFYNEKIWNRRFANVIPMEGALKILSENA